MALAPDPVGLRAVAEFFATKYFAVRSKAAVKGLSLAAVDAPFTMGAGPVVKGRLLDLVMAMAGSEQFADDLSGDGVGELLRRLN